MTEGTLTGSPTDGGEGSTQSVESMPQSVAEVEAFWRNRFSQRDKAHNAETAALKAQMEALQQRPAAPVEGESPEAARVRELEAALAAERTARATEALKSKYPLAAATVGDAVLAMDEAKLAGLEAALDNGFTPPTGVRPTIDPNAAPRRAAMPTPGQKPINEKSKEELLADLKRMAPAYQQAAKEGLL